MKKLSDIARAIVPPFQNCANCTKDGWRIVHDGHPSTQRCPCWLAHQEKIARVAAQKGKV